VKLVLRSFVLRSFAVRSVAAFLIGASTFAPAQVITGTVTNRTTNKPAAGDEVVLLSLGQGMEEAGRTRADAKGSFTFNLTEANTPHLLRAIHQNVTYHRMAPPGTTSVEVEVYDVSKKLEALSVTADVIRLQAQGSELHGVRLFSINNNSSPPLTQMNDHNFEFYLPAGAQIDTGMAKTAGGQPINSSPVPQKEKDRYAFVFPLRPGETQFQVAFHLPYNGETRIDPRALHGAQHFVVMLPKTMQFTPDPGSGFQSMQDPRRSDAVVQIASNTQAGQPLAFRISGTGTLSEGGGGNDQRGGEGAQTTGGAMAEARDSRPGGGLGPPIDAPDPLEKYRWYILSGFATVLVGGAIYIARRSKTGAEGDFVASDVQVPVSQPVPKPAAASRPGLLLEALKEEIFQLELDHKQGRISQEEYVTAKAALDHTLERAIKRERN
jgi:hypothetical protein